MHLFQIDQLSATFLAIMPDGGGRNFQAGIYGCLDIPVHGLAQESQDRIQEKKEKGKGRKKKKEKKSLTTTPHKRKKKKKSLPRKKKKGNKTNLKKQLCLPKTKSNLRFPRRIIQHVRRTHGLHLAEQHP